jgi:hypothetical protein
MVEMRHPFKILATKPEREETLTENVKEHCKE